MKSYEKKKTSNSNSEKSNKSLVTLSREKPRAKIHEEESAVSQSSNSRIETIKKSIDRKNTIEQTEDDEKAKEIKLLDKIINLKAKDITVCNNLIDNVCIEDDLFRVIDLVSNKVGIKNITSPREESETHKLIDSREYNKLKKDNYELKKQKELINTQYNELFKANYDSVGELNFLITLQESQEKDKKESINKIRELTKIGGIMKDSNEKLKEVLLIEKTEKDNIFRAILSSIARSDESLAQEFKNIYQSFNNQDFLAPKDNIEEKIEGMMGRIKAYEKEIAEKNFELNGLKKFLIGDQNKKTTVPPPRSTNKKGSVKKV